MSYIKTIKLRTKPNEFYDITENVRKIVKDSEIDSGFCLVFCPGSTGSIILNENEPMLLADIRDNLDKIVPKEKFYHHSENAASHIKATLLGCSKTIPVEDSELQLGTWQAIIFSEWDIKPRQREIIVKILGE